MREQPDFSTSPRPRRPPLRDFLAVALGILALGFALRTAWSARQEAEASRDRLSAVRGEVRTLEGRIQALSLRAGGGGVLLARAAAASEAPPERIVAALAAALPDDVRVDRLTVAYEDVVSLEMQIVARNAAAWDIALERLARAAPLEQVVPGPERREGEVRTSVRAQWKGVTR